MDQSFDIAISESIGLKFPGIVRMTRHVVGTDGAVELHVPQNAHDLEKIHVSFIGVDFREIVKSPTDVAHMDLVNLSSLTQIFGNGKHVGGVL